MNWATRGNGPYLVSAFCVGADPSTAAACLPERDSVLYFTARCGRPAAVGHAVVGRQKPMARLLYLGVTAVAST